MTTVYVRDKDKATQEFNCSDGSTGVLKVEDMKTAPTYYFKFYAHSHPSFRLADNEFHDGEELTIRDILDNEQVALKFI
ncbi:hypothetical protein [Limosilactobacillus agrestimuris]|uniref:hypothetical protein n=1 Tax=Limosilactobacillus agrestimuris TaxID=2941331 RepID=UPI00203F5BEA|nr:hypothetical protein [Limosilactobacillus agrestimuris]